MLKKCKNCTHSGRDCFPYIASLPSHELIAWCKIRKEAMHMSNGEISERSNVPKGTVDRIFSSDMSDCRLSTILPIICVLSGCTDEELTCDRNDAGSDQKLYMRAHDLEKDLNHAENTISLFNRSVQSWKRAVIGVIALCVLQEAALISYIRMDIGNADIGYFRGTYLSPVGVLVILCVVCAMICTVFAFVKTFRSKEKK